MTDDRDRDLRALYRAAATETPPEGLNRRIMEAARRSVKSPLAKFTPFGGHWPLALSAAAVVMVCATLVLYLMEPGDAYLDEDLVPRQPAAPPAMELEAVPRKIEADRADAVKPAAPAAAKSRRQDKETAESRSMKESTRGAYLGGTAAESAAEAVAPPPVPARQSLSDQAAAPGAAMERHEDGDTPEHQLAAIRRLFDAGETAAARRSLKAFVARYPDFPLPTDLEALLGGAQ